MSTTPEDEVIVPAREGNGEFSPGPCSPGVAGKNELNGKDR
ncbi:MAG TPA: hypothetical protein VGL71_11720 [Urbifossiella sp.]